IELHYFSLHDALPILERVIPFFERNPLLSDKRRSFSDFAHIVRSMDAGKHLTWLGFEQLVRLAHRVNGDGRYRKISVEGVLESRSEEHTSELQSRENL